MISYHEHWQQTHVESTEPAQRERDGGGGQQECEPQMVANYTTMRAPARTKELIAARDGETLSRETLNLSTYLPPTFCLVKWDGGFRNNWKKCLRGGVGIGNSAERGMWAGKRYNSTPIMLKRLMRAAPSSHKSPSSPGVDNLLGNFLMLLIVSAAEWLWREYWRGWQVRDKWEYSQQLHFKMQSDSTQGPSFFWITAFWDILNVIRVSFWSLEHSPVQILFKHLWLLWTCGFIHNRWHWGGSPHACHRRPSPAFWGAKASFTLARLRMGIVQASGWRSVTSLQFSCVKTHFLLYLLWLITTFSKKMHHIIYHHNLSGLSWPSQGHNKVPFYGETRRNGFTWRPMSCMI